MRYNEAYDFNEFMDICGQDPLSVYIFSQAEKDACRYFHLCSKNKIRRYISIGFMENMNLIKSIPLKKTKLSPPPMVDSYKFQTGQTKGYFAYYRMPNGKWMIKSLKIDKDFDRNVYYCNTIMGQAIEKSRLKMIDTGEDDE